MPHQLRTQRAMTVTRLGFSFRNVGRTSDDEWEIVEPALLDFWTKESDYISEFDYTHQGCNVKVRLDWRPYTSQYIKQTEFWHPIRLGQREIHESDYKNISGSCICQATVEVAGTNELAKHSWYAAHFLQVALYDAFIIANIALPGSLDLYSAKIWKQDDHDKTELRLSSYLMERGWIESLREKFPKLDRTPVRIVRNWHSILGTNGKLRAETSLQRAIFCLYYLGHSDNHIDGLIWVFYGLEALLQTKIGENISGMLRRISLLLDMNERDRTKLRKHLKHAYDLRSAFVHGGYVIDHPIHNEVMDPEIDKAYGEALELQRFGITLIVALLQKLAQSGVAKYHFREVFVPHIDTSS